MSLISAFDTTIPILTTRSLWDPLILAKFIFTIQLEWHDCHVETHYLPPPSPSGGNIFIVPPNWSGLAKDVRVGHWNKPDLPSHYFTKGFVAGRQPTPPRADDNMIIDNASTIMGTTIHTPHQP